VFAKAREKARQTACLNNQRQIVTAILMYAQDHDETLPDAGGVWGQINLDKGTLICPTAGKRILNGYIFNSFFAGMALGEIYDPTGNLLIADGSHTATTAPVTYDNVAYSSSDLAFRHSKNVIAAFADGHVEISATPNLLGSQNILLWLRADAGVTKSGSTVSAWRDEGIYNTVLSGGSAAYVAQAQNGYPAINIPSGSPLSATTLPYSLNGLADIMFVGVSSCSSPTLPTGSADPPNPHACSLILYTDGGWGGMSLQATQTLVGYRFGTGTAGTNVIRQVTRPTPIGTAYSLTTALTSSREKVHEISVNSSKVLSTSYTAVIGNTNNALRIGNGFQGNICELLVIKGSNRNQLQFIESYLRTKYALN
jgi:prepilin-type processing-associated H-X9-DG protein